MAGSALNQDDVSAYHLDKESPLNTVYFTSRWPISLSDFSGEGRAMSTATAVFIGVFKYCAGALVVYKHLD